jgi:hypothetical protein
LNGVKKLLKKRHGHDGKPPDLMAQQPATSIPETPPAQADGDRTKINGEADRAPTKPEPAKPKTELLFASVEPGLDKPIPRSCEALAKAVLEFEKIDDCQAWLILQSDTESKSLDNIDDDLTKAIVASEKQFEP